MKLSSEMTWRLGFSSKYFISNPKNRERWEECRRDEIIWQMSMAVKLLHTWRSAFCFCVCLDISQWKLTFFHKKPCRWSAIDDLQGVSWTPDPSYGRGSREHTRSCCYNQECFRYARLSHISEPGSVTSFQKPNRTDVTGQFWTRALGGSEGTSLITPCTVGLFFRSLRRSGFSTEKRKDTTLMPTFGEYFQHVKLKKKKCLQNSWRI